VSGGLQVLPLPAQPVLVKSRGAVLNDVINAFPAKPTSRYGRFSLGVFMTPDATARRGCNFILPPDHAFWDIKTADEFYAFCDETLPQCVASHVACTLFFTCLSR
jgi:hypothetical protein